MNGKRLCLRLVPLLLPPAALLLFCALRQNGVYTLFPYAGFLLLAAVQGFGCRGGFAGFGRGQKGSADRRLRRRAYSCVGRL